MLRDSLAINLSHCLTVVPPARLPTDEVGHPVFFAVCITARHQAKVYPLRLLMDRGGWVRTKFSCRVSLQRYIENAKMLADTKVPEFGRFNFGKDWVRVPGYSTP